MMTGLGPDHEARHVTRSFVRRSLLAIGMLNGEDDNGSWAKTSFNETAVARSRKARGVVARRGSAARPSGRSVRGAALALTKELA